MPRGATNFVIALATLLLLCICFLYRDTIPAGNGAGYDGEGYVAWVKTLSIGSLIDSASMVGPAEPLDRYRAHRILPSLALHYALRGIRVSATTANVIVAFAVLNIALLMLTVVCWLTAADELRIGGNGKWLGVVGLIVSYANLKMPLYYAALTDTAAFAAGAACVLFYVKRRTVALWITAFAGGFIWPTFTYFGFLLMAFPREQERPARHSARRVDLVLALGVAAAAALAMELLVYSGYEIKSTPIHPMQRVRHLSVALACGYLFLGLRPLLDSRALWQSLRPRAFPRRPFVAACFMLLSNEVVVGVIAPRPATLTVREYFSNTFLSAAVQPLTFYLAHVLYFGPILIFVLFMWTRVAARVREFGPGAIAYFGAVVILSVNSESRLLINVLPFVVLLVAPFLEEVIFSWPRWATFAGVTFICSKVWLRMDRTLSLPYFGDIEWRSLYVSSRGPWIDHPAYLLQLLAMVPVVLLFCYWQQSAPLAAGEQAVRLNSSV
jgi:hypothetical protein